MQRADRAGRGTADDAGGAEAAEQNPQKMLETAEGKTVCLSGGEDSAESPEASDSESESDDA